jgi:hypothetical protein
MERMSVIAALQRQRFAVRDLPVLSNGVDQLGQSQLAVPVRFAHTVFDDPAFQINRSIFVLAGGGRFNTARVFQDPAYLGQIFPSPFSRGAGSL